MVERVRLKRCNEIKSFATFTTFGVTYRQVVGIDVINTGFFLRRYIEGTELIGKILKNLFTSYTANNNTKT